MFPCTYNEEELIYILLACIDSYHHVRWPSWHPCCNHLLIAYQLVVQPFPEAHHHIPFTTHTITRAMAALFTTSIPKLLSFC